MARRALLVGVAVAVAVVGACSLPSAGEFAAAPVSGIDGGADARVVANGDAAVARDAATGGTGTGTDSGTTPTGTPDAGAIVDLLGSPSDSYFDDGTCGPDTGGYQANESSSTPARSGAGACLVCRAGTSQGTLYTLDTQIPVPPRAGQTYHATAWVRRTPGSSDTTSITLTLRTHNGDFNGIDQIDSAPVMLSDDYQELRVTVHVTQDASDMDVYVGGEPPPDLSPACFLIDDLLVWRD